MLVSSLIKKQICTQRHYITGGQEKRKDRKLRSEEKVVCFSSAFQFHTRKWEAVIQGGTKGIEQLKWKRTQRAGIVKGWEERWDRRRIPDTCLRLGTPSSLQLTKITKAMKKATSIYIFRPKGSFFFSVATDHSVEACGLGFSGGISFQDTFVSRSQLHSDVA